MNRIQSGAKERPGDCAVRFEHVSKGYGGTGVLRDFSLEITRGSFLTMIGRSGCGKTTALKLINGLLMPDAGTVYVDGENVAEASLISLRRHIGYAIQGAGLFPHMTVAKNIAYVPSLSRMWDRQTRQRRVTELLDIVGLEPELACRYPSQLSGGQRQRAGIARALAAQPDILLMDEPFGAVDEITRRGLQDQLLALQRRLGVTVVFVTHDIGEALKLGTQVLVMEDGRTAQLGTPEDILSHPASDFVRELAAGR